MTQFFLYLANKIGLDKAIAYSSGARVIQAVAGVGSVFFITKFLTGIEQGFYYTFGSLLAIQIFFELGLTGILTQYVAHEASHLELLPDNTVDGEQRFKSRLSSLVHFSFKWYGFISMLFLIVIIIIGFVYFSQYDHTDGEVSWKLPWLLISVASAIKLFQSPFNSILMGLNKVKEMNKIMFYQQLILPLVTWVGLACNFKLYVVGIGSLFSAVIWNIYIYYSGLQTLLFNLWKENISAKVGYMREIFPYQWRIALSWISGYFIFQLFNPVLFATEGAVAAGQMGMTLSALTAIQAFSFSWLNTKVPLMSSLIAQKDFKKLDYVFCTLLWQMALVCAVLLVLMVIIIWVLDISQLKIGDNLIYDRFLPYIPMLILMVSLFLDVFTNAWATYLRCHKQEPFLAISICGGVTCALSTFIFGNIYGLYGITIGYLILKVALFPWGYCIFKTKKLEWHENK